MKRRIAVLPALVALGTACNTSRLLKPSLTPLSEFLETAATDYGATIQPIHTANPSVAPDIINDWVSDTTRDLIPKIVQEDTVKDQILFLVNTVYLKAGWENAFDPEFTHESDFTTDERSTVKTEFMSERNALTRNFVRLDNADAIELRYLGDELAMWLVVRRDDADLAMSRLRLRCLRLRLPSTV